MYRNYKEMHPIFWNFLTLIDHNFGTKSPFELKQKTVYSYDFWVFDNADISSSIADQNFGIWKGIPPSTLFLLNGQPPYSYNCGINSNPRGISRVSLVANVT